MVKNISIIIVTWKVKDHLKANLEQLFKLPCKYSFEVFVVDNASEDGTVEMVRNEFPQVKLIQNDWDAGFAGPNNQALRLATGEVCILLNPDMMVQEGTLDRTYEKLMSDKTIGVMGVRLNSDDGKTPIGSVRRYPTFGSQLAIVLKLAKLFPSWISYYMAEDFDYTRSQDVDQVRGSYFAFRRELLDRIGPLDAGYHIWFEEVDYCRQVKKHGLRIHYLADVTCTDYVGQSFKKMRHLEKQLIFTHSMVRYFQKWHPMWQTAVIAAARPIGVFLAWGADMWDDMRGKKTGV